MANISENATIGATPSGQNEEVQKELQTRFALLPEELQKVITSSDYQMKLFDLAKKYKMTYERLGTLELETTLVLLGMTHPKDFPQEMKNLLRLPETDFNNLMTEIQVQVFDPIKKALQTVYPDDENESGTTSLPPKVDTTQKSVMEKAGINIGGRETITATPDDTSASKYSQNDLLKSIENPPKSTATELNKFNSAVAPSTTPVVAPISKPNESMQDSINNLLNKTAAPMNISTEAPKKTDTTNLAPAPDMPPMAPSDAAIIPSTMTTTRPTIDTISVAKKTSTDYTLKPSGTPTAAETTSGDPYRESV
jgi:hypothetical protein